jgi:hypothetical protein
MIDVLQHSIVGTHTGPISKYLFDYTKYMTISKPPPEKKKRKFVQCIIFSIDIPAIRCNICSKPNGLFLLQCRKCDP